MGKERQFRTAVDKVVHQTSALKGTLENMNLDALRKNSPDLEDSERLLMCQKTMETLLPELRKSGHSSADEDSSVAALKALNASLLVNHANFQILLNRHVASRLGYKLS